MVTVAAIGAPSDAPPVALVRLTLKVSALSTAVSLVIATAQVLLAASPSAQFSVTDAAVKSAPAAAVSPPEAAAVQVTLTAPLAPPLRITVIEALPAASPTPKVVALNASRPGFTAGVAGVVESFAMKVSCVPEAPALTGWGAPAVTG